MSQYDEYLEFAKAIALEAGEIMLKYFSSSNIGTTIKKDETRLTVGDTEINSLVIDRISKQYPEHSVLGEEESKDGNKEYVWVCDPIDGTLPFSLGIPVSTFNLALVRNGKTIVAVQNDPFTKELAWAAKGKGTYLNGVKLKIAGEYLGKKVVECEIYSNSEQNVFGNYDAEFEIWRSLYESNFIPMKLISAAKSAVLIANNQLAGSIFSMTHTYEAATTSLIVSEAGGLVTDIFGEQISSYDSKINGLIMGSIKTHEEIVEVVKPIALKNKIK